MVKPTVSPESNTSSTPSPDPQQSITPFSCGRNDITWDMDITNTTITVWMDHETTEQAAIAVSGGASLTAMASSFLSATVAGAIPGVLAAVLAAALTLFAGVLTITDDGCGVKLTFTQYHIPIPPFGSIEPQ